MTGGLQRDGLATSEARNSAAPTSKGQLGGHRAGQNAAPPTAQRVRRRTASCRIVGRQWRPKLASVEVVWDRREWSIGTVQVAVIGLGDGPGLFDE